MSKEQMYGYTFPLRSGGIYLESPFKIHVGQIFNYWGYTWKVEASDDNETTDEEVTEFFCVRYDD